MHRTQLFVLAVCVAWSTCRTASADEVKDEVFTTNTPHALTRDESLPGRPIIGLRTSNARNEWLKELAGLKNLRTLDLSGSSRLTDAGLKISRP